jgi:hypothetical protein
VKSGDAFYGDKYISVKAGDKIIIPVTTKPDYDITKWLGNYTFAASVRGNSSAQGYIGVAYSPDGSNLMTNKYGETAKISVNTDGKWVRSGYNFTDYRWTNLYLVIECTAGSFDVDYISMFNQMRSFKENPQLKDTSATFTDYKDMGSLDKGNYIGSSKILEETDAEPEDEPEAETPREKIAENKMTEGATLKDDSDKKPATGLFGRKNNKD